AGTANIRSESLPNGCAPGARGQKPGNCCAAEMRCCPTTDVVLCCSLPCGSVVPLLELSSAILQRLASGQAGRGIWRRNPLAAHLCPDLLRGFAIDFKRIRRNDNAIVVPGTLGRHIAKSDILDDTFNVALFRRTVAAATARQQLELAAGFDRKASRLLV